MIFICLVWVLSEWGESDRIGGLGKGVGEDGC